MFRVKDWQLPCARGALAGKKKRPFQGNDEMNLTGPSLVIFVPTFKYGMDDIKPSFVHGKQGIDFTQTLFTP